MTAGCGCCDVARRNVTRHPPRIGRKFIPVLTQSRILPGDGNYRYYLNAGIIAMTMNGTALGMGRRPADRHVRGNRR
jgi:hypothetical protein